MRTALLLTAICFGSTVASAQAEKRPEVLILGTFHMSNPGRDVQNMQADDMLSERRQREIMALMEVLRRFRPTKIAIEDNVNSSRAKRQFADYVAGTYTLSRNEIDQIGYRLAKELGHTTIYPVDEDGEYQYMRVRHYAIAKGMKSQFDSMEAQSAAGVKRAGEFLRTHTVIDMLARINEDSSVAKSLAGDYSYVQFGEPWEYAGSDLLTYWFQRNMRIYRNIQMLATSADDRLLVIYGGGHLPWLRGAVAGDVKFTLRKFSEFVTPLHPGS